MKSRDRLFYVLTDDRTSDNERLRLRGSPEKLELLAALTIQRWWRRILIKLLAEQASKLRLKRRQSEGSLLRN